MESMILRGVNASGLYTAGPQRAFYLRNIDFNLPTSGTLANVSVTLSGSQTGAYTFNNSVDVNLNFKSNEDVYVSTSSFLATYGVVINYLEVGDASSYMQTDRTRAEVQAYPTPWRFR
jgi:hypothetical protein